MFLKTLEMQGFKSFPDKTKLSFDTGLTVVVGPNGSGKSNIADAMKWVLGEISSKNLRGSRMEDVIFGGTETRKQMGFAEVTVTFDNTDSGDGIRLATPYDEVSVTRRFYRAGDSEYFINEKPVRLKDIHELFMNTGVGRDGYSIIGQGKIAEIISRKSEERRSVFEEAAGISKYRYKKEEAQKKLVSVEDNLVRVRDIVGELEGRVGTLEKESEKARKYLALHEEKKQADVSLWLYDMQSLKDQIEELAKAKDAAQKDYDAITETIAQHEAEYEELSLAVQKQKLDVDGLLAEAASLTEDSVRLKGEGDVLANEASHIEERQTENRADQKAQLSVLEGAKGAVEKARTGLSEAEAEKAKADAVCEEDRAEEAKLDAALDRAYERVSELEESIREAGEKAADLKAQLTVLENSRFAGDERRAELDERKKTCEEAVEELRARVERAETTSGEYRERSEALERDEARDGEGLAKLSKEREQAKEAQDALFLAYTEKKNRIDSLARMEELLEGYSRSVRFIMNESKEGKLPGAVLYGPLSKLITVSKKYVTAIETAFGANIQNIAVKDEASAKAAILRLKEANAGRATFYPLTTIRETERGVDPELAESCKGYLGVASDLVRCEKQYEGIIRSLLSRTLVCDTIDSATEIARKYDFRVRVVTLDGQQINAGGSFTGGSVRHDSGMLTRTAEIDSLTEACKELSAKMEEGNRKLSELDETYRKKTERLEEIRTNLKMIAALLQAEETQKQVLASRIQTEEEMLSQIEEQKRQLEASDETREQEEQRLNALTEENRALQVNLAKEREQAVSDRESAANALGEHRKTVSRHAVTAAELGKDIELAKTKLEMAEQAVRETEQRLENAGEEQKSLKERHAALLVLIAEKQAEAEAKKKQAQEVEAKASVSRETYLAGEQKLSEARLTSREESHTQELLFRQLTIAENRHSQAQAKQDEKTNSMWDEYELTYSKAVALNYPPLTEETRNPTAQNAARLKNQIKALGAVNVSAIEEYAEVRERYDFMTAQIEDLEKSEKSLTEVVFRLEGEMRERFADAMKEINRNFKEVFRELFGGGSAELILTEPDNLLESGIEINVAPPGKIIRNLMLLSGGEQAFVAIALYFALLKVNPSPFCILDEIEAALDEVNVDKFAAYLRANMRNTQYIVISHRRGTMEAADRLYGVTMVSRGISTVLTIDSETGEEYLKK
ncbi:MAG: chromosome segregation protein SMC [Clostridia bacterium]|nr:chromosome segregation protein SMC [Clostridia bacterium]